MIQTDMANDFTQVFERVGEFRRICQKLLNARDFSEFDPLSFIERFREKSVLNEQDEDLLRKMPSGLHRTFCFFMEILPSKTPEIIYQLADIFRLSIGFTTAAVVLENLASQSVITNLAIKHSDSVSEEPLIRKVVLGDGISSANDYNIPISDEGSTGSVLRTPEELEFPANAKPLDASQIQLSKSKILGRGSFAVVYAGLYQGKQVAVKKFRDYDNFSLRMFAAEIDIMSNLDHVNVIKFIGCVFLPHERQLWLLTEFVSGGSMRRFCNEMVERSLSQREKLIITAACWKGLSYLHSRNCCHKDISPDNILISDDLEMIKISDFGLSEFKVLMTTATTQLVGTPLYHPPEFAKEGGIIRHPIKSDVYSMGASLCELFAEEWFWNNDGQARTQYQVMFILIEQRRCVDTKMHARDPDCWRKIPENIKPMMRLAIDADYETRKTATELSAIADDLLQKLL